MTSALAGAWAHGPGKHVVADPPRAPRPHRRPDGTSWSVLPVAIAAVLRAALGPKFWDPGSPHNDHRAHPSVRPCRAHDAWLVDGARRWRLDPVRELLIGSGEPGLAGTVEVLLVPDPDRLPAGYGDLRVALALLEVGHVAEALVTAAGRGNLAAVADADGHAASVHITDGPSSGPLRSARRTSGDDRCGLAVDPRPLPAAVVAAIAGTRPLPGSIDAELTNRIAVHNVAGMPEGAYVAAGGRLLPHRPGPMRRRVAAAFRTPPSRIDAGAVNLAWALTADIGSAVRAGGDLAYPRLLIAAGAAAQRLGAAAADAGLFCRPVRAIEEPEMEAVLGAPPDEDVLYVLLIGRGRTAGPSYDLTAVDTAGGSP